MTEKEKLLMDIKSYLSDYEMNDVDTSKDVETLQGYVGDAHKLLEEVKEFLDK